MTFNRKVFIDQIKVRKHAIIIGGLIGAMAANYAISHGQGINEIIAAGKGLLDSIMARNAALEIAQYKLYGAFISLGAFAGFYIDMMLDRFGFRKKPRKIARRRRRGRK